MFHFKKIKVLTEELKVRQRDFDEWMNLSRKQTKELAEKVNNLLQENAQIKSEIITIVNCEHSRDEPPKHLLNCSCAIFLDKYKIGR